MAAHVEMRDVPLTLYGFRVTLRALGYVVITLPHSLQGCFEGTPTGRPTSKGLLSSLIPYRHLHGMRGRDSGLGRVKVETKSPHLLRDSYYISVFFVISNFWTPCASGSAQLVFAS